MTLRDFKHGVVDDPRWAVGFTENDCSSLGENVLLMSKVIEEWTACLEPVEKQQ